MIVGYLSNEKLRHMFVMEYISTCLTVIAELIVIAKGEWVRQIGDL